MFHIEVNHDTHPRELRAGIALLQELLGESTPQATQIAPADRPDAGIIPPPNPVPPPAPMSWPQFDPTAAYPHLQAMAQGGAVAPLPLPSFAPSAVGAAASPIAPAALPASGVPPTSQALAAPPAVSVAAPTAFAAPSNPAGVVLDAKGLPWDGRIHSSGKSKIENGTWKMKKGVINDLAFVSRIEAELRQVLNMQVPPAPAQQHQVPPAPAPQALQWQQPAPAPQAPQWQQPAPMPQPAPAPMQQPQNISGPQTFADFNAAVSAATSTGQISVARLLEVVAELGLPSVPMLQHRPELVPIAWAKLTGQMA